MFGREQGTASQGQLWLCSLDEPNHHHGMQLGFSPAPLAVPQALRCWGAARWAVQVVVGDGAELVTYHISTS